MAILKWICGAIGWATSGTLGGILGFCVGTWLDGVMEDRDAAPNASDDGYAQSADGNGDAQGQRASFLFSVLVLSSYIIRADGKVMHSEMEVMRAFLRQNFGAAAVEEGERILLRLFEFEKQRGAEQFRQDVVASCAEIRQHTTVSVRLQLLYYLVAIAKADGKVPAEELSALQEVAYHLGLNPEEVVSMLNLDQGGSQGAGGDEADKLAAAYKVLEVEPTATDSEVKAAFRKLALKHHPDRVAALGEDVRKAAERKFQEINEAKERIYKARGMN